MRSKVWLVLVLCAFIITTVACGQADSGGVTPARKEILRRDLRWFSDSILLLRFDPLPGYVVWKQEIELCSGMKRDGFPTFLLAPIAPLPGRRLGFYVSSSNSIVLALGFETEAYVVRHELLHYVLDPQDARQDAHPPEYFGNAKIVGKCGPLVNAAVPGMDTARVHGH